MSTFFWGGVGAELAQGPQDPCGTSSVAGAVVTPLTITMTMIKVMSRLRVQLLYAQLCNFFAQ